MKKLFNILLAIAAVTFAACTSEDNYEWAQKAANDEVFFHKDLPTSFTTPMTADHFVVTLNRVKTADAITVPVVLTDESGKYSLENANVSFAAGASTTDIVVKYDPEKVVFDEFNEITLEVKDANYTSEYGKTMHKIKAGLASPWKSLGKGHVVEDYLWGFETDLEIFQNEMDPNLYRIKNFIGEDLGADAADDVTEWIYMRVIPKGSTMTVPVKEPYDVTIDFDGLVYFYGDGVRDCVNTGYVHPSYNDEVCFAYPWFFTGHDTPDTWAHNKVLGYKADGSVGAIQLAPYYYMWNTGGWNGADSDGSIVITFPGFVIADYSADVETVGRLIDAKGNGQAVFNVTLGKDVASAKVAMAAGKDASVAYQMILDGDESVQEISASGELRFAYDEPGDYVCVVVTYDAEGAEQEAVYTLINIPASGETPETFQAVFIGTYTHGVQSLSQSGAIMWEDEDGNPYVENEAVLYESNMNEGKFLISPWIAVGYDEETVGQGLTFLMDDEGNLVVENALTGVDSGGYGEIGAWDVATAGFGNVQSYYDPNTMTFNFALAWTTEAILSQGAFGFTLDTYVPTAYASEAKAKAPGKKFNKPMFNNRKIEINTNLQPIAKKAPAKKTFKFKAAPKKFAKFKK